MNELLPELHTTRAKDMSDRMGSDEQFLGHHVPSPSPDSRKPPLAQVIETHEAPRLSDQPPLLPQPRAVPVEIRFLESLIQIQREGWVWLNSVTPVPNSNNHSNHDDDKQNNDRDKKKNNGTGE
jgi:hypothetical protein